MTVGGYVLIEAEVGKAKAVGEPVKVTPLPRRTAKGTRTDADQPDRESGNIAHGHSVRSMVPRPIGAFLWPG
jgi:hypothetical protein